MDTSQIQSYAGIIPVFLGIVAPLIASFLSRQHWPSEVTAGLTVLTSAAIAFVSEALAAGSFSLTLAFAKALVVYVIAAIARSQFWEKTGTDAKVLAFPQKTPPDGVQPGAEPDADYDDHDGKHEADAA